MEPETNDFFSKNIKPHLCHDNFTGNLLYWAWKDLDCTCCAFFRGLLFGAFVSNVFWLLAWMIF